MNYAIKTITGRRKLNEDSCCALSLEHGGVFLAVADGMGGHAAGDVASRMLIDELSASLSSADVLDNPGNALRRAIRNSNLSIFRYGTSRTECKGMGTTLVCAFINGSQATIANIGDSRLYHFDGNALRRITKDHSLVQTLIDEGSITVEEAAVHPMRNVITRAVGSALYVDVDLFSVDLAEDDLLLLCSDGLHGSIDDDVLCAILKQNQVLASTCDALIDAAYAAGSRDNITVVLASVKKEAEA